MIFILFICIKCKFTSFNCARPDEIAAQLCEAINGGATTKAEALFSPETRISTGETMMKIDEIHVVITFFMLDKDLWF